MIVIKYLLFLVLAALSSYSLAAPDNQLLRKLDIQRGLFSDSYQIFEIEDQQIIYVLQENQTAITRGVAVLVADSGVSIVGQQGFAALANELNKLGWVTILLPAPEIGFMPVIDQNSETPTPDTNVSEGQTDTEAQPDTEAQSPNAELAITESNISKSSATNLNPQAFVQHEQRLISLLEAAFEKSQDYPGFFLVIGKGTSAAWLTKIYAQQLTDAPDAFVAVSPFWPDRTLNQRLAVWMATTAMPVLDLYSEGDNEWAKMTVAERQIASIKSLKLQYRQRELVGSILPEQHSTYMSKEIYGWLSHMGW